MKKLILLFMLITSLMFAQNQTSNTKYNFNVTNDLIVGGDLSVSGSSTAHADIYFNSNGTAQTPVANDTIGVTLFTEGDLSGFTFDAGESGTFTGTADNGGDITITCGGAHTVDVGDWIVISQASSNGSYDIDGVFQVTADGGTTFDITFADWDASETGVWQSPSQLTLSQVGLSNATFRVDWNISASVAGTPAGDQVIWGCYVNGMYQVNTMQQRTLSTGSVYGSFGNGGFVTLTTGDEIFMFFLSDDVNALTHKLGTLRVEQL